MKFIILLLLVLVLTPVMQSKEKSKFKSRGDDLDEEYEDGENNVTLIGLAALVVFSIYLYYDLAEKKKMRELLAGQNQIPQENQSVSSNSNQVYLK